jgi:hypothetical protein
MAIATPTTTDIDKQALSSQSHSAEIPSKDGTYYGAPEVGVDTDDNVESHRAASVNEPAVIDLEGERQRHGGIFAYMKTRHFWIVLVLG